MVFIPPNREKLSTKSFFKWFRGTIFAVPIAFSLLYNMLLYYTSMWHCFGKNKKSKYQARQSRLGGTARQWLLYPTAEFVPVPGRFGPESFRSWVVSALGRFGPGRFGLGRFGPGSFRPNLVGRFGLIFLSAPGKGRIGQRRMWWGSGVRVG